MKILTVVGARPQFVKAAALSREIRKDFDEVLLHTGQHFDDNMSGIFFRELEIPEPDYNLGISGGSHASMTARMMTGIEEVLLKEKPDAVVVFGDTNSTLAGALAAAKQQIPVFHIEAGLRSFNMTMPEEQNRIVADQLSNICFAPTQTALDNLRREGFIDSPTLFLNHRRRKALVSGDIMYDNSVYFARIAAQRCTIMQRLQLQHGHYVLATVHRNYNTDDISRLTAIFNALATIAKQQHIAVIVPLHPRTKTILEANTWSSPHITIIPPVSYLEMIELERHAQVVMTDSGGVQKEAFFYERPCVILRPETEWVEIVEHGAGLLADADTDRIVEAYARLAHSEVHFPPLFGKGHAAEFIINEIINYLK